MIIANDAATLASLESRQAKQVRNGALSSCPHATGACLPAMVNRTRWLLRYLRVFCGLRDVLAYRRVRRNSSRSPHLVSLRLRQIPGTPMLCRSGTTDAQVLWDTFYHMYHVPPLQLRRNAIILDLGANVGYTAAHLAVMYPNSKVIGVEMDEENARLATTNTRTWEDWCHILHAAVWSEDGEVTYGGTHEWGYRVSGVPRTSREEPLRNCAALTVDTIIRTHHLTQIDYVKMDIEGSEAAVVAPGCRWLSYVGAMVIELHSPANGHALARILESFGFECRPHSSHPHALVAIRPKS